MENKLILILGDVHANNNSLEELKEIFQEVYYDKKELYSHIIFLGDVLDRKTPSNQEIDFLTKLLIDMQNNCPITIVTGNHEETTSVVSALDYTRHFGINLIRHHGTVTLNNKTIYLGHHFVDQSAEFVKDENYKVEDLAKYDLAFLGHDHQYREYKKNVISLGSLRRVTFAESDYGSPVYAKVDLETLEISLGHVISAIPMIDVESCKDALKQPSKAKVRLIIRSFEDYLKILSKLPELEVKFHTFKVKHDYSQQATKKDIAKIRKKGKSFEEIFNKFLEERVENKEVRTFIEENIC